MAMVSPTSMLFGGGSYRCLESTRPDSPARPHEASFLARPKHGTAQWLACPGQHGPVWHAVLGSL